MSCEISVDLGKAINTNFGKSRLARPRPFLSTGTRDHSLTGNQREPWQRIAPMHKKENGVRTNRLAVNGKQRWKISGSTIFNTEFRSALFVKRHNLKCDGKEKRQCVRNDYETQKTVETKQLPLSNSRFYLNSNNDSVIRNAGIR